MYYTGIIPRFKVDRPLSEEDRKRHLHQDRKVFLEPTSALSVIRINSGYVELADKFYPWRGLLTAVSMLAIVVLLGIFIAWFFFDPEPWREMSSESRVEKAWLTLVLVGFNGPILALSLWVLSKDSFGYTHYPIRLNREGRKVYVFRADGSILETSWDDLFITMGPATPSRVFGTDWDLRAHVLDKDGEMVRETFAFGYVSDPENLRHYFAYLQRYMDEGPQAVAPYTLDCLDIVDQRETAWFGFKRLWLNMNGWIAAQILMLPLFAFSAIGRVIAMRTSKIPLWPAEVEAANPIDLGDPWARDARTHPAR